MYRKLVGRSFQFLGIPPKGEQYYPVLQEVENQCKFPISRDPPEGGTFNTPL